MRSKTSLGLLFNPQKTEILLDYSTIFKQYMPLMANLEKDETPLDAIHRYTNNVVGTLPKELWTNYCILYGKSCINYIYYGVLTHQFLSKSVNHEWISLASINPIMSNKNVIVRSFVPMILYMSVKPFTLEFNV